VDIIIGGDLLPTQSNIDLFNKADLNTLLGGDLLSLWNSADNRIFNLETPLTDEENPIDKFGPNFMSPKSTIKGIKALNPSLVSLANNHILDQGEQGLKSTQDIFKKNNIPFVGVGGNISDASVPFIIKNEGLKIGIYACVENEFSIATEKTAGANPFNPLETLDHILELKNICNYVLVLYHGGKEWYRYPSPYLQKVCRKLCEKGADLVVCQHSHSIGSFEEYNGSTIIYGQGNFIFDEIDNEFIKTAMLLKLSISNRIQVDYIPIVKVGNVIRIADVQLKEDILSSLHKRSKEILKEGFIEHKYKELIHKNIEDYLRRFAGFNKWLSFIDRRLLNGILVKHKYSKIQLLAIQNYLECEAHRELIIAGLKERKIN